MKFVHNILFHISNSFRITNTAISIRKNFFLIPILIIGLLGNISTKAQVLIAGWDFQTVTNGGIAIAAAPSTQITMPANFGTGNLYLNGTNGSSTWVTTTAGNQLNAFGGSNLNLGSGFSNVITSPAALALANSSANGKSMVFSFNMATYTNLVVSYVTQRTATGFTTQQWDYSNDGINWTSFQNITVPTAFAIQTLNSINALNFDSTAYLRVTFNGAGSAGGNNRIDNIQFNAIASNPIPVVNSNSATGVVGMPFSYFISATNFPQTYSAIGLPAGLTLNTNTGEISGAPTMYSPSSPIQIQATNSSGTGNGILTLQINQGNQIINFPTISAKKYGDPSFNLTASGGGSSNPIVYTSSDLNVATIAGSTVTIIGAGSCTITASQAGDANYFPALDVSQNFVVNKDSQIINFPILPSKLITDLPFSLNANGGSSGNPVLYQSSNTNVATIIGNIVTIVGVGSTIITATQQGNINYHSAVDVSQVLEVTQVPQIITFNSLSAKLITDPPFQLIATGGGSGNPITFTSSNTSVATINGNLVTLLGAGITTITASQAGNAIYSAANDVTQSLLVNANTNLISYSFGTSVASNAYPTNGVPISNLDLSAISQGNNANTTQTSLNLSTTSASNNSGSSGEMNAGITARNRNFQIDSSAFFEFTLTPTNGSTVTLSGISFNSRSTSTGPTTLDIRSSVSNFANSIAAFSVNNNSTWAFQNPSFLSLSSSIPLTLRIYGYVTGGNGSISSGSSPNNWRIDDIKLSISVNNSVACSLTASVTATPIICNGGTSSITVNTSNSNGVVNYKLNNNSFQASNLFSGVLANTYTVTVMDAFLCTASTSITINEPSPTAVSAINVSGCAGVAIPLYGYPQGGTFSVPNPYIGSTSTVYTYSYTDSVGCTSVSAPANISTSSCAILNLKLYIESYYIGSGFMRPVLFNQGVSTSQTVVDDLTVQLYDPNTFSLVSSTTAVLNTDGTTQMAFPGINGFYYIVIKHRNALQTWSASPVFLSTIPITYDFTTSSSQAYGSSLKEISAGVWGLFSGDIVQDENIDLLDETELESDIENFIFGYFPTDLNGDGNVDLLDGPALEENIGSFVFSQHPVFIVFPETMENGVKTSYTAANITLSTGVWNFEDALIGTSSSDRKNGTRSARIQNIGKITMNFDVFIDSSVITISHAKYAAEANSTWALFISSNGGTTWTQEGAIVTTSSTSLQNALFVINAVGNMRFQVRKLSGGRLNIDDFNITANTGISINDNDHIAFGNPSDAVTDISFPDNYLLIKSQYDLAYDNSKGLASWVAWHLDLNDLGTTPRCDCFATDVQLPSSFFRASNSSYSGTGFDRGHQVPSSHRNNNITNNAVTFLMSNIMPQSPNLNQLTWNNLEQYCLTLVNNGNELYTYSGGYGSGGTGSNGGITFTIAGGNITVPSHFWKIIVVLPVGNNDISRVTNTTRVIAVDMPNTQTVSANAWGTYRTSVDAIETATGFDFLKSLPLTLQSTLEATVDSGPTN